MSSKGTILGPGGSGGIGRATVRRLVADGVDVVFTHHTGRERAKFDLADHRRFRVEPGCRVENRGRPVERVDGH